MPFSTAGRRTNVLLMNEGGVLVDRTALFAQASDVLGDLGIPVRHRLMGVGENYRDHLLVRMVWRVTGMRTLNEETRGLSLAGQALKYAFTRSYLRFSGRLRAWAGAWPIATHSRFTVVLTVRSFHILRQTTGFWS